jgi:uncharacterized protein
VPLPNELLEVLRCPACHGNLRLRDDPSDESLDCPECRVRFPVRDGIPIMLLTDALPL